MKSPASASVLLLAAAIAFLSPAARSGTAVHGAASAQEAEGDAAASAAEADEDGDETPKTNADGKPLVTVRGCLHGVTLGDVESDEDVKDLTPSLALRTSRDMRRKLKEYDRHHVEITGVLKPAPRSPLSGRWGGTTVTVGAADPRRSPAQQTQPAVASLEVEAVESLAPSCP